MNGPTRLAQPSSICILLAALLPAGAPQAGEPEDAVDYRQSVMQVLSWNAGHLAAMAKGEAPYDAAAFRGFAQDLASAASLDLLKGFPEGSVTEDSDAREEIWLNWPDFEARLKELRTQTAKLALVAVGGDRAAMEAQLKETRGACKACHDDYKQ
jgi:cytochrome c556